MKMNEKTTRNITVDILKGILILLMIYGHYPAINPVTRKIIFSFHMPAFVILSGFFYKKRPVTKELRHLSKSLLLPYFTFCCIKFLFNAISNFRNINLTFIINLWKDYLLGMSFSNKIFTEFNEVGAIWFILMLFLVRLVYSFIDNIIENKYIKGITVILISLAGLLLGKQGIWLPWSLDVALYCIIYYWIGHCITKYKVMDYLEKKKVLMLLPIIIWVIAVSLYDYEIALRQYGGYVTSILGATSATIALYIVLHTVLKEQNIIANAFAYIGKNSLIIYCIHSMGKVYILAFLDRYIKEGSLPNVLGYFAVHLLLSAVVICIICIGDGPFGTKIGDKFK